MKPRDASGDIVHVEHHAGPLARGRERRKRVRVPLGKGASELVLRRERPRVFQTGRHRVRERHVALGEEPFERGERLRPASGGELKSPCSPRLVLRGDAGPGGVTGEGRGRGVGVAVVVAVVVGVVVAVAVGVAVAVAVAVVVAVTAYCIRMTRPCEMQ